MIEQGKYDVRDCEIRDNICEGGDKVITRSLIHRKHGRLITVSPHFTDEEIWRIFDVINRERASAFVLGKRSLRKEIKSALGL